MKDFIITRKPQLIKLAIALVVFVVAVVVINVITNRQPTPPTVTPPMTATVIVNKNGFLPASLKIKLGMAVIWRNQVTTPLHLAATPSNNNGSNSLDSQSNIAPNGTYAYTFTQTGTYHYVNLLNPVHYNGTVTVEQ